MAQPVHPGEWAGTADGLTARPCFPQEETLSSPSLGHRELILGRGFRAGGGQGHSPLFLLDVHYLEQRQHCRGCPFTPFPAQPLTTQAKLGVWRGAPYHSHYHPDQGDQEERPQHVAHHGVAVCLRGTGHCCVTHDIGSRRPGWPALEVGPREGPPPGSLQRRMEVRAAPAPAVTSQSLGAGDG